MRTQPCRRGFSLIELMIVIAIILIIAAIAIPHVNEQLMAAHETAAIRHIRTINTVQVQHYAQFGKYAPDLFGLGAAGLISKTLADVKKSGYILSLQTTAAGYSVTAIPETLGSTGRRQFYSDQTGVIRNNWSSEPPSANSAEIP
jgi:type IV pilus assembly protein PilA